MIAVILAALLSLTNATDYVSSVPANTNLIKGVGMGSDWIYRSLRGEDMDFLMTAYAERYNWLPHTIYDVITPSDVGRIPVQLLTIDSVTAGLRYAPIIDYQTVSNAFKTSLAHIPIKDPGDWDATCTFVSYVPSTVGLRSGLLLLPMTGAEYLYNGVNVWTNAAPFVTGEPFGQCPEPPLFVHMPSLAAVTNAYAQIESDIFSNALFTAKIYWGDQMTNKQERIEETTSYRFGELQTTTTTNRNNYLSTSLTARRSMTYTAAYSINADRSIVVDEVYKSNDTTLTPNVTGATPFRSSFNVLMGRQNNAFVYNTDLVISAMIVGLFETVSSEQISPLVPNFVNVSNSFRAVTNRLIVANNLGELTFNPLPTINLWQSGLKFHEFFNAAIAVAGHENYFGLDTPHERWLYPVTITPRILDDADFAPLAPDEDDSDGGTCSVSTTRINTIALKGCYLIAIIHPTYHARVLAD